MKKLLCMVAFVLSVAPAFTQNIFIANNRPGATGGTNVYTGSNALIDALSAAVTGDVIYVVPSSVVYQTPVINKGITLIGAGFNPNQPGSDVSTVYPLAISADNVRLSGLVTELIDFTGGFANIMIDKCRVKYMYASGGQGVINLIIQNCIIGEAQSSVVLNLKSSSSNVKISNSVIYASYSFSTAIFDLNAATIENNVFVGVGAGYAFGAMTNCNIKNNIFYGVTPSNVGGLANNDQQNNLSYGNSSDTFSTSDGNTSMNNIEGQDPLFKNLPFGTTSFSFSYDLHFQNGSPAVGSGVGGTDIGVFGGLNPYDIYGTSLPIIRSVTAPNTVSQGTNMNVRIEAKGN